MFAPFASLPRLAAVLALALALVVPTPARAAEVSSHVGLHKPGGYSNVYLFDVEGEINDLTLRALQEHLKIAREKNAELVLLRIDTYGGEVASAIAMCEEIRRAPMPVVAWVNTKAISAGAMIAVACSEIVMADAAVIGDCAPISGDGQSIQPTEREKIDTFLRSFFRISEGKGYNRKLLEAMVTRSDGLYLIERRDDPSRKRIIEQKYLDGYTDAAAAKAALVPEAERGKWTLSETVLEPERLLTMHTAEALRWGFAEAQLNTFEAVKSHYEIQGEVTHLQPNWGDNAASWLGSTAVRGVLMSLLMLSIFMAFSTPGHGLPEIAAGVLLVLVLVPPYLSGLANIVEVAAVIAGLILLAVEIFILPGFGVAGVLGIVLLVGGLVMTFVGDEPGQTMPITIPSLPGTWDAIKTGLTAVILSAVAALGSGLTLLANLHRIPGLRNYVKAREADPARVAQPLYVGAGSLEEAPAFVGDIGVCETDLYPSGKARIRDGLVHVVAPGQFLTAGTRVRVIDRDGGTYVVEAV